MAQVRTQACTHAQALVKAKCNALVVVGPGTMVHTPTRQPNSARMHEAAMLPPCILHGAAKETRWDQGAGGVTGGRRGAARGEQAPEGWKGEEGQEGEEDKQERQETAEGMYRTCAWTCA